MSEKLKELISLLYQDKLTQCGKRLLVENIEKYKKQMEELNIRLQEEINEKCKLKTELYLNSIPKSKIENKIETYRRVVADSNDGDLIHDLRTAIHILEELLGND